MRYSLRRLLGILLTLGLCFCVMACDGPRKAETAAFEEAEVKYRAGDYDEALEGYQSFLRLYPESPLAEVAEMRIRNIRREVKSMLGRSEMLRPVYHKPDVDQAPSTGEDVEKR